MTTIVSIAQGGTGSNSAALARTALGVPPSAAYDQANTARDQANTARTQANTAYDQANTARTQANTAYGQANAAYGAANTRLSASGGTLSGDLIITGNLTVSGNSTTLNTEILTVEDADIVLLSNVASTPALNAGIIVNRGTSTNTFLRWNEVTDRWGWSDDGTTFVPFANAVLETGDTMTGNLTISGATLNTATANISTIVTGNALTISTGTASNGNIIFSANGTEDMRITAPGNVGIGTNSPLNPLHVAGGYNQYGQLYIQNTIGAASNANVVAAVNTTGDLLTLTAATGWANGQALIIKSTVSVPGGLNSTFMYYGCMRSTTTLTLHTTVANAQAGTSNVDITSAGSGTITLMPVAELATMTSSISNSSYLKFYKYRHTPGADWQTAATRIQQVIDLTHQGFIEFNPPNGTYGIAFGQGSQYFMQINSSGNVGIGTSSPTNFVHINDTAATGTGLRVDGGGSGAAIATFARTVGATGSSVDINASNNDPQIKFTRQSAGTYVIGVPSDGSLRFTSNNNTNSANDRVVVTPAGNVGIGTSSPGYKIEVTSAIGSYWNGSSFTGTPLALSITNSTSGGYDPVLIFQQADSGGTIKNAGAIGLVGTNSWTAGSNGTQVSDMYFLVRNSSGGISERMRIKSDGNVGIGTTSPGSRLSVNGTIESLIDNFGGSEGGQFVLRAASGGSYRWNLDNYGSGTGNSLRIFREDDSTAANGAIAVIINSALRVGIGTESFNTNGGKLQVADGISFPATQSACSDANTLDDYEEGTWTPELRDGATVLTQAYSYRSGVYHKIGRMVHVHFGFLLSSLSGTSTNALRVYGLPFTSATTGGYQEPMGYAIFGQQPTAGDSNSVYFFVGSGQSFLEGRKLTGSDTIYTSNQIDGDTFAKFSMIYWV